MKKITLLMMLMLVILTYIPSFADGNIELAAEAAVLIDYDTESVLFEKNMDQKMYPASTTKIMTAYIILKNHDINEIVTVDGESPFATGSKIYLFEGEELTVHQLLYALLVQSANDAAEALARFHSGDIESFAAVMNQTAKELGMTNTNFVNPHGLQDENHYTTAADLAKLSLSAFENETFREIVNTEYYELQPTNKQSETRKLRNTNRMLYATGGGNLMEYDGRNIDIKYDGMDGIKTGFTEDAGACLVSTAVADGMRLISVVLKSNATDISNSQNYYTDTRRMLDYGFDNFVYKTLVFENASVSTMQLTDASKESIMLYAKETLKKVLPREYSYTDIDENIVLYEQKLPIDEGQTLGRVEYIADGETIGQVDLVSNESVSKNSIKSFFIRRTSDGSINYGFYTSILINLLITFILWRVVITIIRLVKMKFARS